MIQRPLAGPDTGPPGLVQLATLTGLLELELQPKRHAAPMAAASLPVTRKRVDGSMFRSTPRGM